MIDLIENWTLLIVGCTALVLAVSEVTRDWRTTWKINAVADAWVMDHEKDATSCRRCASLCRTTKRARRPRHSL
jgi:hypothetical protein